MNEKLSRPQFNQMDTTEKQTLMESLAARYNMTFLDLHTFDRWGQSSTTGIFEKDGRKFVFVPGDTVTLGWEQFAVGLNQEMADYLKALEPEEWHNKQEKIRQLMPYKLPAKLVEYLKTGPLRLEFPDQEWVKWAELYSFMDVQEMTWKRKKLLSLMVQMDNYSDYLLLWSPRDKKLWYLDIEHEEFHPLAKWDDFIADPGRYLNGMIEGEFEE